MGKKIDYFEGIRTDLDLIRRRILNIEWALKKIEEDITINVEI